MNRVTINILGNNYTITTESSEERIREIETELNDQLNNLRKMRPTLSLVDTLVLVSLNLMDQINENENSDDNIRRQLIDYMEEASRASMEAEELRREVERLRRENTMLKGNVR